MCSIWSWVLYSARTYIFLYSWYGDSNDNRLKNTSERERVGEKKDLDIIIKCKWIQLLISVCYTLCLNRTVQSCPTVIMQMPSHTCTMWKIIIIVLAVTVTRQTQHLLQSHLPNAALSNAEQTCPPPPLHYARIEIYNQRIIHSISH